MSGYIVLGDRIVMNNEVERMWKGGGPSHNAWHDLWKSSKGRKKAKEYRAGYVASGSEIRTRDFPHKKQ